MRGEPPARPGLRAETSRPDSIQVSDECCHPCPRSHCSVSSCRQRAKSHILLITLLNNAVLTSCVSFSIQFKKIILKQTVRTIVFRGELKLCDSDFFISLQNTQYSHCWENNISLGGSLETSPTEQVSTCSLWAEWSQGGATAYWSTSNF